MMEDKKQMFLFHGKSLAPNYTNSRVLLKQYIAKTKMNAITCSYHSSDDSEMGMVQDLNRLWIGQLWRRG